MKTFKYFTSILTMFCLTLVVLASCKKEEVKPSIPDQTMYHGDKYNIPVKGNWTSSNPLIAYVEDDIVEAITIGNARISNGEISFNVNVNPKYNLYKEPFLSWGSSPSAIRSFMSSYNISSDKSNMIIYEGRNKELNIAYSFTSSKLSAVGVFVKCSQVTTSEIVGYLCERYIPVGEINSKQVGLVSNDKKTAILMSVESSSYGLVYYIFYSPLSNSRSMSNNDDINSQLSEIANTIDCKNLPNEKFEEVKELILKSR